MNGKVQDFGTGDRLDLLGIAYGGGETVAFKENAAMTSGTLTVTSGAASRSVVLLGNYATSNFQLADDAHGGTFVKYHI
jgi:hypothetical protein